MPHLALTLVLAAVAASLGCVGANAVNLPLESYTPNEANRAQEPETDAGEVIIYLAFSGGGTRAAAFAYGVMEELHETVIGTDGASNMLAEVDTISGVSGGSFPAAYYGVYGDRIFDEFEDRFLKRNVQGSLMLRGLAPWNLVRLATPWLSRSDLASQYYNKHLFEGATFGDLRAAGGPRTYINATDLSSGTRMTFTQESFELICSDLDVLPLSVAVAASSAVPMLLSPISMRNYAGQCGYEPPGWVQEALDNPDSNRRVRQSARNYAEFSDRESKPYIHLIDGGISDNLGLRASIDFLNLVGDAQGALEARHIADVPKRIAVIAVNAETDPNWTIDLSSAAPSFAQLMNSVSGSQIRRYNLETLVTMETLLDKLQGDLSRDGHTVETYMVDVSFDVLDDPDLRTFFKRLPTSFVLTDGEVDELRGVGRRLLRESPEFQKLVESLR